MDDIDKALQREVEGWTMDKKDVVVVSRSGKPDLQERIAELEKALARLNAGDVDQLNEYEKGIAELERHNELLRAVAEAAQIYVNSNWNPNRTMTPESPEANLIRLLQAAIDGRALGE